ncbi:MAG: glycosyltransferase [Phycisphaerae bacterium]|nr:glycosyltransferase [Phycisphaerae bacterium]
MRNTTGAPRVAALVLNSVNHDARVVKEADALAKAGFEVRVIGLRDDRCGDPETVRPSGVRIVRIDHGWRGKTDRDSGPSGLLGRVRTFFRRAMAYRATSRLMRDALDRFAPVAVHCHDLTTLPIGAHWCRGHDERRLIFDSHELYEESAGMSPMMKRVWKRVLRRHASHVNGFITVNESIAAEHAKRYPTLPKAVVVMNAAERTASPPVDDGRLRAAAGVAAAERILLYQGGYSRHRGLEDLVRSAAGLPDGWTLVLMGWGSIEAELRRIADADPRSRDRVRFVPPAPQSELCDWSAGATLGVIPYENTCLNHWYCTPNKLWEYPSAGVPVLASPFPELRRAIESSGMGRLLPQPLTSESLGRLVADISEDDLAAMRAACQTFVAAEHWGVYAARLVAAYRTWVLPSAPGEPRMRGPVTMSARAAAAARRSAARS